jgi:hypothetical protein
MLALGHQALCVYILCVCMLVLSLCPGCTPAHRYQGLASCLQPCEQLHADVRCRHQEPHTLRLLGFTMLQFLDEASVFCRLTEP